jgi:serine/threonine protein kinase/Tol biopolymer transport system component
MNDLVGQTILHYKIIEQVGHGGMGVVYKAHDLKLDRTVALKFLPHEIIVSDNDKARFLQEARAASAVIHPNVCVIHDISEYEGQQFIVMEFVDGKTLRQIIPLQKMLDVINYAIQIGEALQEAHGKGVVHRDIKTDNIMVNTKNQIKVMDFGLAKLKGSMKLTKTMRTAGTLSYMSPEQIQGKEVDARSDIFSFGIVMFEMLTGKLPFFGEFEAAMIYSIINEEPEPLQKYRADISSEFLHVINRALEKEPEDRYQTMNDMLIDLHRAKKETSRDLRISIPHLTTEESLGVIPEGQKSSKTIMIRRPKKTLIFTGMLSILLLITAIIFFTILPFHAPELNPDMSFRILPIPLTQICYPGLSYDGNWIAFPSADLNGKWDIYFMNAAGSGVRRVTMDSSLFMENADISFDGNQIAYDRINSKTVKMEVCIVSSLGGESKKIAEGAFLPRWRPDGQRIGYAIHTGFDDSKQSTKRELWSVIPDGSDNKREFIDSVSSASRGEGSWSFSWSPDGKSVAWLRSFPERYQEVIIHELVTGKERQLTFDKKNIDEVCWTSQNEIIFSSNKNGNMNLYMIPASGGAAVQLTKGSGPDLGMKISHDGKKLLYVQLQDIGNIWISRLPDGSANINSSSAHQVTYGDRSIRSPSFSPDSKHIVFTMKGPDPLKPGSAIYVMDRDGANRREITSFEKIVYGPRYSKDGRWISYFSHESTEPQDSARLYIIDAINPGKPKLISSNREFTGLDFGAAWLDSTTISISSKTKPLLMSIKGGKPKQFFEDSTSARPILNEKYILYFDNHKGKEGRWIIQYSKQKNSILGTPKKVCSGNEFCVDGPDGKFLLLIKDIGNYWRISLPDCRRERLKINIPGLGPASDINVGPDGTEIVYVDSHVSGKLVMIENFHE